MKVSSFAVARPAYYDRNATSFLGVYDAGGVAPHGATIRITITLAATRKLLVEAVSFTLTKAGVSAPVGEAAIYSYVIGSTSVPLTRLVSSSNVSSTVVTNQSSANFTVFGGETYQIGTYDTSTGGTNNYVAGAKGSQFDV